MTKACLHQLARVVAIGPANNDYHVRLLCQLDGGMLPLLRRLAHSVNESNLGIRKSVPQNADQVPDFFNRLRRLRRDSEPRALSKLKDIGLRQDNVEICQVFGDS